MRVFIPATLPLLERWSSARLIDAPTGFAVTPALREWYATGDAEELEYAALTHAARASIRLLAEDADAPARRVVVAADAEQAVPDAAAGRAGVRLTTPLKLESVAAVHADDAAAERMIRAAAAAVSAAEAGDPDAEFAFDEAEAIGLSWYATQEIPDLLAGP
ncbi:MAG TPA: hypothetical protein VFR23_17570 [Jiangellaceae bacterium]|nr:hypothetical protein [Jiangellaceae bacterium]